MQPPRHRKTRQGLSLIETLVVCTLMGAISAFTIVLYATAMGDFEHANVKYSMHIYARRAMNRIDSILSTATPRRPNTAVPEALYWPTSSVVTELQQTSPTNEVYVDFVSAHNFIQANPTECAYAFDNGVEEVAGYTQLFRYRLGWTPTQLANVPPNAVYLARIEDTSTLIDPPLKAGTVRQVLCPNIGRVSFLRTAVNTLQVRLVIYAFDSATGRGLDGQRMSSLTKRRRRDATSTATDTHEKSYELLSSIPLATITIK